MLESKSQTLCAEWANTVLGRNSTGVGCTSVMRNLWLVLLRSTGSKMVKTYQTSQCKLEMTWTLFPCLFSHLFGYYLVRWVWKPKRYVYQKSRRCWGPEHKGIRNSVGSWNPKAEREMVSSHSWDETKAGWNRQGGGIRHTSVDLTVARLDLKV